MLERRTINVLLTALVFGLAVALIYIVRSILMLFAFSILFAYLIDPAVRFLQRYSLFFKNLRGPHIFQAYLAFLIVLALLVHAFAPEFRSRPRVLENLPALADRVTSGEVADDFGKHLGLTDAQILNLKSFLQGHKSEIESAKQAAERSTVTILSAVLVIPILAIFFLSDGEQLANQLVLLMTETSDRRALHSLFVDLNLMLQRYIRAKVILGLLSLLSTSLALLTLGFPHWLALGVLAGILEFIPIAGWMMAATAITAFGFVTHSHWIWILALLGIWRIIMDYAISPRVMGHQLEIHPLLAIFTVMAGAAVGGIAGIYISVPLVASLRVIWRRLASARDRAVPAVETAQSITVS